jgi:4-carboxymuconolactone decarboxylase
MSEPTRAQAVYAGLAPKLDELSRDLIFGDIWKRPQLTPRDRSLITIACLVGLCRPPQIEAHMKLGLANGLTVEELVEVATHLAFYAGFASSSTAVSCIRTVIEASEKSDEA